MQGIYDEGAKDISSSDKPKVKQWLDEVFAKIDSGEMKTLGDVKVDLHSQSLFGNEELSEAKINKKDIKNKVYFAAKKSIKTRKKNF
jgi:hypothetical protein